VLPFVHGATAMPLDVVVAGSGLEEEFLRRARPLDIGGVQVPVIAKILAARAKDLDDARGIWRAHREVLDRARIESTLEQLEQALGQSDLRRSFDAIVKE
jgi:hypothetical protein